MTGSVVCLATGSYLEEWKDCIETQQRYCETFGYDYHLLDKDISALHPKWQKFERSEALLREGRHVLLIDADAAILPAAPPFESVLEENPFHDIFAVLGRSKRPNSGVIIFRSGETSVAADFLHRCISRRNRGVPKEDFVTREGENGHFIHYLKKPPYAERFLALPTQWNNTLPPVRAGDFVTHYASGPMRRLRMKNKAAPAITAAEPAPTPEPAPEA